MDDLTANLNLAAEDVSPDVAEFIESFLTGLRAESEKNQLQLVKDASEKGEKGLKVLMRFLQERRSVPPSAVEGCAYQRLVAANLPTANEFLQSQFPRGLVEVRSLRNIDYAPLQTLLARQDFEAADRLTLEKMCELAGGGTNQRRWLYFTEVEQFPSEDLQTINTLWRIYSEGKFGFSVQRELWLATGKNWEKLWPLIGWKSGNNWTRYPGGFTWDLSAPKGHLPLSNQLRGVRVMSSLLTHPAWNS
jgi:hypothetical protein